MSASTRPYRGVGAEERRAARRERLLAAGLDLLGSDGWAHTTVTALCARAGLTERYFYESFPDREALLLAVFDRVATEAVGAFAQGLRADPRTDARTRVASAAAALVDLLTRDPRKGRVAMLETGASDQLQRERYRTLLTFARLLSTEALPKQAALPADRGPSDTELTAFALVGALAELLITWLAGELAIDQHRLVEHWANLFAASAGVTSSGR